MSGLGPVEFTVIAVVALMLFGPTLLAFWLGFVLGKKRGTASEQPGGASVEPPSSHEPVQPQMPSQHTPELAEPEPTQSPEESTTHD